MSAGERGGPESPAVEALQAEVARLRKMLEHVPSFIGHIDLDDRLLYLNQLQPGFDYEQVIGSSVFDYIAPAFRAEMRAALQRAVETGELQSYSVQAAISADELGYYLTRVAPIVEAGKVTSLVLVATDVTELRRTVRELDESQARLRLALAAAKLGMWTHTPSTATGSWDEVARTIIGAEPGQTPDLEFIRQRIHPDDRERVMLELHQAEKTGTYGPIEHRFVDANGRVRWVEASGVMYADAAGTTRIVGGVKDITEQRALEARLLEAQKLESLGRLAGGIAHDFNNLLTAVLSNINSVLDDPGSAAARPLLHEIREASERSAALTSQLLAFARRQVIEPKIVDPNEMVSRLDTLLRRVIGPHIRLSSDLRARGLVRVDPTQLEQVLLNLATNARDAMTEGGDLGIATADVVVDGRGAPAELGPGAYVTIAVTDTGPGIAAAALPHIFEPFYSTREGGTGLGLATCHGIVAQAGGGIVVRSDATTGTSFTIYLPRAEGEPSTTASTAARATAAGGATILVVEDEPLVRRVVERTLARAGFTVTTAASPAEAIALVEGGLRFDLLLSDLMLPQMTGQQLAARLAQYGHGARTLFVSGYTEAAITDADGAMPPNVAFLQKPFLPGALLDAVRGLLERP